MEENLKEIGYNLRNKECPDLYCNILQIQDTLDVLSGKWKIPILFAICHTPNDEKALLGRHVKSLKCQNNFVTLHSG